MPRSRSITRHCITITEDPVTHEYQVARDRRVLIDYLDHDEAVDYAERYRKPDEQVWLVTAGGSEHDLTKTMRSRRLRV